MTLPRPDPRAAVRRRRLMLASAATLAATVWAALQGDDTTPSASTAAPRAAHATERSASMRPAPAPSWPGPPDPEHRQAWHPALPQGLAAWSGPPPPPPTAAAGTAKADTTPQPPPFPYTLIGRLDDGEPRALLSGPLRSFGVKASEVIDGQWRVDAVLPTGVTLTWLPGSLKKNLSFASS